MVLASREFQLIKSGQKIKGKEGREEEGGRREEGVRTVLCKEILRA